MKKISYFVFLVIFIYSCEDILVPETEKFLSAKEEFDSLPEIYREGSDLVNYLVIEFDSLPEIYREGSGLENRTIRNRALFFKDGDSLVFISFLPTKIPWRGGYKDLYCFGAFGGSVLVTNNLVYVIYKGEQNILMGPDSIIFSRIKINAKQKIILESCSQKGLLSSLNERSQPTNRATIAKSYWRYDPETQELVMD